MIASSGMRKLLDAADAARGLMRVAGEIIERHRGTANLVLVGIRRGGVPLAEELRKCLEKLDPSTSVPMGIIDITLYRDDASTALPSPRIGPSHIPVDINDKSIILVDDVVGTGRTLRAALDAVLDYGRPARVEVFALMDRGGLELPIYVQYCVRKAELPAGERVDVVVSSGSITALAVPSSTPSLYPLPVDES
jgi:pyrimidine operon attenuation protein / uracil phosphoribosyltransferase